MNILNSSKETVKFTNIAVAKGDGIGPEIMEATLKVLRHSGARLKFEFVEVGEAYYEKGYTSGLSDEAWEIIKRNKILLKGPITTPQGGGYKSINVTLRKALGLYANVRPCFSYYPFIETKFHNIDTVIIRENEEDLYAGIEYRQTKNSYHAIKVITRKGSEKIVRYAFEYAKRHNRKKVTCMTKDNIMKGVDGLFHSVFDEIAKEYPEIQVEHYIIDIGSARLATKPEIFDVVVTLNLYGDIISDIVAELTGSVGLAGSSNIGDRYAMFEAIHGSAPTLIGQGVANPTAILNGAIMMLVHIGQGSIAKKINDAILYTIESGAHTPDIYREGVSARRVSTEEFADEIIKNLGKESKKLLSQSWPDFDFDDKPDDVMLGIADENQWISKSNEKKELHGVDIFINLEGNAQNIGDKIENILKNTEYQLKLLSARGIKVYPLMESKYITSDDWRLRVISKNEEFFLNDIIEILQIFAKEEIEVVKTENLYSFDGKPGYSVAQGE